MDYSVYRVPEGNIAAIIITMTISIVLPLVLLIFWKIKSKAKISAFFIGCGFFILSALVLEQICHSIVFLCTGSLLMDNIWLYALYGGLAAAVFEETGRFVAMRFCMKKSLEKQNAIMYGIGHGGIESVLIVGLTYVVNLCLALIVNGEGLETIMSAADDTKAEMLFGQISLLWETPGSALLLAGVERISAIMLQIVLSYIVYRSVKYGKKGYWFLAAGIHFVIDAVAVLLSKVIPSIFMEGILMAAVLVLVFVFAAKYRKEPQVESF